MRGSPNRRPERAGDPLGNKITEISGQTFGRKSRWTNIGWFRLPEILLPQEAVLGICGMVGSFRVGKTGLEIQRERFCRYQRWKTGRIGIIWGSA